MDTNYIFTEMRDNSSTDAARIEDLGPRDFVKADCAACSHTALLSTAFLSRLGVLDLKDRMRCRGCGARGSEWFRSSGPSQSPDTSWVLPRRNEPMQIDRGAP
jgi:hypothetical protein